MLLIFSCEVVVFEKMSQLDPSGCKKRKRGERVFKFKAFCDLGYPVDLKAGSFARNVEALLEVGQMETGLCEPMGCWSFQLEVHRDPLLHVFFFVVEEPIELSQNRFCKDCQYIGWGNHLICNKKYHFVLPSKHTVSSCLSFESVSNIISSDVSATKSNFIELEGHSMHGVIHSNGFGHLLCINGAEENGSGLPGIQIMDFWDRLCTGLSVRKVSLRDTSQKNGMDLRLLHALAYGKPWFGHWGYRFGHGCYGVNQMMYQNAIISLQNIPLGLLAHHLGNRNNEVIAILSRYQMLSANSLATLSNIFHFMCELKGRLPRETNKESSKPAGFLLDGSCRWSPKRVEMAIKVIIEALKRAEFRWISRQQVRDAARVYIGDTGLLDFVLKSLGNHVVGKYLVRRCLNPVTKVLEYRLEDVSNCNSNSNNNTLLKQDCYRLNDSKLRPHQQKITWAQVTKDINRLYKNILNKNNNSILSSNEMLAHIPVASTIILHTKYLIKDYFSDTDRSNDLNKQYLRCTVVLVRDTEVGCFRKVITPHENFALEYNCTFDELKLKVERTFKDLYWGLRNFFVRPMNSADSDVVSMFYKGLGGAHELEFEGEIPGNICADFGGIFENSDTVNVVVDCHCGTKSEDGERMVCCDICEVWQHTRCVKIPNNEAIPSIFVCSSCEQDILHFPSLP